MQIEVARFLDGIIGAEIMIVVDRRLQPALFKLRSNRPNWPNRFDGLAPLQAKISRQPASLWQPNTPLGYQGRTASNTHLEMFFTLIVYFNLQQATPGILTTALNH